MQQSAVSPKISLSIDVKQVLDLVQSLQKDTSSKQHQRLNIDIYLGPNHEPPASSSGSIPQGPHEVNRGAWAMVPPNIENNLRPASPSSTLSLSPTRGPDPELTPATVDANTNILGTDAATPDIRSRLSQSFGGSQYTEILKVATGEYQDLRLAGPGPESEARWRMLAQLWEYCATERFAEFPAMVSASLEHRNICLQRLEELQRK